MRVALLAAGSLSASLFLAVPCRSQCARGGFEAVSPYHSQARVNDPRSHGVLGDRLLSLREAILLTNRDLDENSLSREELAQLAGFGGDIAWADIDANVTPTITFERDLPLIRDTNHGFKISGNNGIVTLELGDTRGIVADSDFVDFANLELRGGEFGIQLTQRDTLFGTLIENVSFVGQGVGGMRVDFRGPGGSGRVQWSHCSFRQLPLGLLLRDLDRDRANQLELLADTSFEGCAAGVDATFGPGGVATLYAERLAMLGVGQGFQVARSGSGSGRDLTLEMRHVRLDSSGGAAFELQADPGGGRTAATLEACELRSRAGHALRAGSRSAPITLEFRDGRLAGAVDVAFDGNSAVTLRNVHVQAGSTLSFDGAAGATAQILEGVLESAAVDAAAGRVALQVDDSRLVGGSVRGASAPGTGTVVLRSCHRAGTTLGPGTSELQPRSTAHRGTFDAAPVDLTPGATLRLAADLPTGLSGTILFAPWIEFPRSLPGGLRLYGDPNALVQLGPALRLTQSVQVPLPNDPALSGLDLFFHLLVLPDAGVTAPARALPPGRRVKID